MALNLFSVRTTKTAWYIVEQLGSEIRNAMQSTVMQQAENLADWIKEKYLSERYVPGARYRDRLQTRSGLLRKSTVAVALPSTDGAAAGVTIGRDTHYANVLVGEPGKRTVIVPKRAGALTIPIGGMTGRGNIRFNYAKGLKGTNLFKPKGKDYLAQKSGPNRLIPLFLLRKSVTVPAKIFPEVIATRFAPFVSAGLEREIQRVFNK
jgi:hypothetical protein